MLSALDVENVLWSDDGDSDFARGKIVGILLDEPSTRNRFSTMVAATQLGATAVVSEDFQRLSIAKGETLEDTIRVLGVYFDVLAIRSALAGMPRLLQTYTSRPVVSLGDGANEHPTQALATLVSLRKYFARLDGLHIVLWGDLAASRSAHSVLLSAAVANLRVTLCAAKGYRMPASYIAIARTVRPEIQLAETDAEDDIRDIDVLYLNREQRERHDVCVAGRYAPTDDLVARAKLVLHPLPRGPELSAETWRCRAPEIMEHVQSGLRARRLALQGALSGMSQPSMLDRLSVQKTARTCANPRCAAVALHNQGADIEWRAIDLARHSACGWCLTPIAWE